MIALYAVNHVIILDNLDSHKAEDYRRPNNVEGVFVERIEDNIQSYINQVEGQ